MIRSTRVDGVKHIASYPKLMIREADQLIVLMWGDGKPGLGIGTVVKTDDATLGPGYYSTYWGLEEFSDYRGSITLENQ